MLELSNIDAGYGGFQALFGISMSVKAGEAIAVIGSNGAGKTTLLRVISGLLPATAGAMNEQPHVTRPGADRAGYPGGMKPQAGTPESWVLLSYRVPRIPACRRSVLPRQAQHRYRSNRRARTWPDR